VIQPATHSIAYLSSQLWSLSELPGPRPFEAGTNVIKNVIEIRTKSRPDLERYLARHQFVLPQAAVEAWGVINCEWGIDAIYIAIDYLEAGLGVTILTQ